MAIKLDLENSFNRVRHSFIFRVLKCFGISYELIKWVCTYISGPWIAPLINGHPNIFFKYSRGLHQGCPMSPFLYIIVVEALSRVLNKKIENGSLLGIQIARGFKATNLA